MVAIFNNQRDRQTAVIITHKHHHNIYLESLRNTAETLLAGIVGFWWLISSSFAENKVSNSLNHLEKISQDSFLGKQH